VTEHLRLEVDTLLLARCSGHHEQVLDEAQEPLGVGRDVRDHRPVALGQTLGGLEQPCVPEDRRDRRPELVGDESEELVLHRLRGVQRVLCAAPLCDVNEDIDRADQRPVRIEDDRRIRDERGSSPVRALGDSLVPADRSTLVERDGHRAFLVTHRPPVRPEELPRPTPFLAQRWASAPEFCGGLIEERDAA